MIKLFDEQNKEISTLFFNDIVPASTSDLNIKIKSVDGSFDGQLTLKHSTSPDMMDGFPFLLQSGDGENWTTSIDISLGTDEEKNVYYKLDLPIYVQRGSYHAISELSGTFTHKYSNWTYQNKCTVLGEIVGYDKIKVRIDYDSSYMRSDFGDIRFVSKDGAVLKYVILEKNESDHAVFLVQNNMLTEFYIISGNPNAEPEEDHSILEVYDDCTGEKITDKWDVIEGNASYDIIDGKNAIKLEPGTILKSKNELKYKYEILADVYFVDGSASILFSQDSTPNISERYCAKIDATHDEIRVNGSDPVYWDDYSVSSSENTFHNILIQFTVPWSAIYLYADDTLAYIAYTNSETRYSSGYVGLYYNGSEYAGIANIKGYRVPHQDDYSIETEGWTEQTICASTNIDMNIGCYWAVAPDHINTSPSMPFIEIYLEGRDITQHVSSFDIIKNTKEGPGSFDILCHDELTITTGMEIEFLNHGIEFYKGIIDRIEYVIEAGRNTYYISGRDNEASLTTKEFTWSATWWELKEYDSYDILECLLDGTGISLGPSEDITAWIPDDNSLTGFAGGWSSRAKALSELLKKISYIKGRRLSWYIDSNNKLRIFYIDDPDNKNAALEVNIYDNPRLTYVKIEESAENIVNKVIIETDEGGTITLQDDESINGWTDNITGYTWPGYGVREQRFIEHALNAGEAQTKAQEELDAHSKPVFSVDMKLEGMVDAQIGQPIILIGNRKISDMVFIINRITIRGNPSGVTTEISATTDKTVVGSIGKYDAVKALSRFAAENFAIYTGYIESMLPSDLFSPYIKATVFLHELNASIHMLVYYTGSSAAIVGCPVLAWKTVSGEWIGMAACEVR